MAYSGRRTAQAEARRADRPRHTQTMPSGAPSRLSRLGDGCGLARSRGDFRRSAVDVM